MNFKKLKKNNFFISLISSFIIFFIIFFIFKNFISGINLDFAYYLKNIFPSSKISSDIVFVKIDDKTTKKLGWPFKRSYYKQTIENIKKDGAKVIGLDILFVDNSINKKTDEELALAFQKAGNIIISGYIGNRNFHKPIFLDKIFSKLPLNNNIYYKNSVKKIGYFNPILNKITNKIYSISPYYKIKNNIKLEHISFALARDFLGFDDNIKNYSQNNDYYYFGNKKIPTQNKQFFINFPEKLKKFNDKSFYEIYKNKFEKGTFKNKLVIIGYTAVGAQDSYTFPNIGKTKGVYTILYTINNILLNNYLVFLNKNIEKFFIFLMIFFSIFITISKKNFSIKWFFFGTIVSIVISLVLYTIYGIYIFDKTNDNLILNYPVSFILAIFFAYFTANIINFLREDKNKKILNNALSEYISKDIAKEILEGEGKINLDGEKKEIAIFFSDIEGFTTISEKMKPQELVIFLQKYLGTMSEIIMNHKGFIDKYEGDAIMGLFGVFGETYKTKTFDILESAITQQEKLKQLNKEFIKTLGQEIKVRMGIHVGEAIIGNIGAKGKKMEFTALGDSVNLASRLEGVNKFYNTYICCSENIFLKENKNFVFRYLDNIKVKGKNKGVKIFEVIGRSGEVEQKILDRIIIFEKGLEKYFKLDFKQAIDFFKQAEELGDRTATIFISRCQYLIKNPPIKNWNGIWEFNKK